MVAGVGQERGLPKAHVEAMDLFMFPTFILVVLWVHIISRYKIVHLKYAQFTVCQLHFNKVNFTKHLWQELI